MDLITPGHAFSNSVLLMYDTGQLCVGGFLCAFRYLAASLASFCWTAAAAAASQVGPEELSLEVADVLRSSTAEDHRGQNSSAPPAEVYIVVGAMATDLNVSPLQ